MRWFLKFILKLDKDSIFLIHCGIWFQITGPIYEKDRWVRDNLWNTGLDKLRDLVFKLWIGENKPCLVALCIRIAIKYLKISWNLSRRNCKNNGAIWSYFLMSHIVLMVLSASILSGQLNYAVKTSFHVGVRI